MWTATTKSLSCIGIKLKESEAVKFLTSRGYDIKGPSNKIYLLRYKPNKDSMTYTYTTRKMSPDLFLYGSQQYHSGEFVDIDFTKLNWKDLPREKVDKNSNGK